MIGMAVLAAMALALLTALLGYACCVAAGRADDSAEPEKKER